MIIGVDIYVAKRGKENKRLNLGLLESLLVQLPFGLVLVGGVITLVFVLGVAVLHGEVEELKKRSEATEEALVRTQQQYEELKKQQKESNLILKTILQLNNPGTASQH
jgi:hypothetical protein